MARIRRIRRALGRRIRRVGKWFLAQAAGSGDRIPDIVLIMGCQRSGTTMLLDVFDRDLGVRAFRDVGRLTTAGGPGSMRLNPLDDVEAEFRRTRSPLVVAKPLADSHRAVELLERFPMARVIWMYRDFRDVAASDLRYFGEDNGIRNLVPMVEGEADNWRSVGVSEKIRSVLRARFSRTMKPHDAGALFWYARNALFFEQALQTHDRVRLLRYEEFVRSPEQRVQELYRWLGRESPGRALVKEVHAGAIGKDRRLDISRDVEQLCLDMQERLNSAVDLRSTVNH